MAKNKKHKTMTTPPQLPQTPKENAKQAIALCHNLIVNAPYSIDRHEQVKAALTYLENLFKKVSEAPDESAPPSEKPAVEETVHE